MSTRIAKSLSQVAGASLLALAALAPSLVQAKEKVTLAYPTNINLSNAPTIMGIGMGYFEQEGLEVDVVFFQGSSVIMPQLSQKHVDFGWMAPEALITSAQPGRTTLPTKLFYNGIFQSPYELVVKEDSPLNSIADLKGKKIGVGGMTWANIPITKSILAYAGLKPEDYELVPVGVGASAFKAFEDGQVDVLNLFDTFHVQMENSGVKMRRLPVPEKFKNLFSNGLITHQDTLKERPELAVKFGRAAAKGVIACNANVEACVRNFWKLYPNTIPSQGTEEQKLADAVEIVKVRLATMIPEGGPEKMGYYTEASLKDYVSVLHAGGVLETTQIPIDTLYTNELVAKINDFDAAKVIEEARAK
ncbi:MAG TPA: ABC transporter substrate-binding protein [Burkholderiaceae bacterium]|nr:ABC transporter substrate-binding protein [Burkholderiaceae bacterium]